MNKLQKLFLILTTLTVSAVFGADIVILKDFDDTTGFTEDVLRYCGPHFVTVSTVMEKKDILHAIESHAPKLFLFSSETIDKMFSDMKSTINIKTPYLSVGKRNSVPLKNSFFLTPVVSPEIAINGLSQFTGKKINSVGYIYGKENSTTLENEIETISETGITVKKRVVESGASEDELIYGVNRLSSSGISLFRIAEYGVVPTSIDSSILLADFIEKRSSAIISNSPVFSSTIFESTPIIKLRENRELTAAISALVALSKLQVQDSVDIAGFTVNTTVASVSIGTVRHFTLNRSHVDVLSYISDQIFKMETTPLQSWSELDIFPFLQPVLATDLEESEITIGNNLLNWFFSSKYYDVLSNIAIVVILILSLLYLILRRRRINRFSRRSVLFYPSALAKEKIECDDKMVLINKVVKKEKAYSYGCDSVEELSKQLRKFMADVFVIDWNLGRESVNFIKNELREYNLSSAVTVILVNAPESLRNSSEAYFSDAMVLVFNTMPDEYDVVDALHGKYKGRSTIEMSEFISGVIESDTLPGILQLLETSQKNGALIIEDKSPLSVLYYQNGRIVFAEDRFGNRGETAIFNGLNCKDGAYSFMLDRPAPAVQTSYGSMEILMEFAAALDHQQRAN